MHWASLERFNDETNESLTDLRVGRIQPGHPVTSMHMHPALSVGLGEHPLRVSLYNRRGGRFHQAIFEPGDYLDSAFLTFIGNRTDWINIDY